MNKIRITSLVAIGCMSLGLTGCGDDAQMQAMANQVQALESAQGRSRAELSKMQLQIKALEAENAKLKGEREQLKERAIEVERSLDATTKDFENFKNQYKLSIRQRAPGMELTMVDLAGKKFDRVRIRELNDTTLTVMHDAGTMSVPLSELQPELQERLGYGATYEVVKKVVKTEMTVSEAQEEFESLDRQIMNMRKDFSEMRSAMNDANRNAQKAKVSGQDPIPFQKQAAEYQVKLNESDVKIRALEDQRMKIGRLKQQQRRY